MFVASLMDPLFMEIWNYLEILTMKKQGWLFQKDTTQERLHALALILDKGSPGIISSLVPFLKDKNSEIRNATCHAIITLFNQIKTKKQYFETLKHCDISKSDIDLFEHRFTKEQFIQLLAIASLNGSGYVREKAVKKLSVSNDSIAVQFLIYRLADWVLPVRQAALNGIHNFKKTEYLDTYINNLFIFEWLQRVERVDLNSVYGEIVSFIVEENKDYIFNKFKSYPDKARLLLAKYITSSSGLELKTIKLLIQDKHFLIRSLVLTYFDELSDAEITKLLKDKSTKIRLRVLYKLDKEPDFLNLVSTYIADSAPSVREYARYSLKHINLDFARIYYHNLLSNSHVIGSLLGIAEIDARQYSGIVESYLQDQKVKVKKTAFLSLKKLDEEKAYRFALNNLDNNLPGIRNAVVEFLSRKETNEVLEKARLTYQYGNHELKKSMLKLFNKIGGWPALPEIILGTIDNNESIRDVSIVYLQKWRNNAVRLFTQPGANELERAKQILNIAIEVHEKRKYFKNNPLYGLNFYLK